MTQEERDGLAELFRSGNPEDLILLLEHSTPARRVEIREYYAGWRDAMAHFLEVRDKPDVDAFIEKLEADNSSESAL